MATDNMERELGWEDEIEKDSIFELVPDGDYDFTVTAFERGRHPGGGDGKLPPCNKAILTIEVTNGANTTSLRHNLFLHTRTEGMICAFFTAIGMRRKGEALRPDWSAVIGRTGRCKVGKRVYDGNEYNDIKKFYEPEDTAPSFQKGAF